jgi:hypothetical protein
VYILPLRGTLRCSPGYGFLSPKNSPKGESDSMKKKTTAEDQVRYALVHLSLAHSKAVLEGLPLSVKKRIALRIYNLRTLLEDMKHD